MADALSFLTSTEQIQSNYEKYKDKFKDATAELVNSETFLNLLVAEMTNQDPLEPTSNTEFVTQMAQFTQLTYAQNSSQYAQANYAASLVGKTATASKMDGPELITKTGVVDQVVKNGDSFKVYIGGETFDLDKVQTVSTAVKDETTDNKLTGSAFGDSIVSASMMIGMHASVSVPQKDGKPLEDAGLVSSIRTKNGEVYLVLESGKEYKLTDVTEVKYPIIQEIVPDQSTDNSADAGTAPVTPPDMSSAPVTAPDMQDDLEDLSYIDDLNDLADISGVADVEDITDDPEDEYLEETEEPVIGDTTAQPTVVDAETFAILEQLLDSIGSDLTVEELLKLEAKIK